MSKELKPKTKFVFDTGNLPDFSKERDFRTERRLFLKAFKTYNKILSKSKFFWRIKYLFYKYILKHTYTIGVDIGSQDIDTSVIVRHDKKGNRIVEKICQN